jgi:hypothetical protein
MFLQLAPRIAQRTFGASVPDAVAGIWVALADRAAMSDSTDGQRFSIQSLAAR